jgi:hypothetical protein
MLAHLQIRGPRLALAISLLAGMGCTLQGNAADHPPDNRSILYGDVTDPSGRPIENARIFLIQDSTRAKLQTWTNDGGNFLFSQLAPDSYTLQAIQTGFAPVQIPAITLGANENRGVDIRFQISRPEETAIIHAGEFEEASVISTRIRRDLTDVLPLNGHTLQPLLLLTPGVVMMANNEFSFNGQPTNMNYFTVDGSSVNLAVKDGTTSTDLGQDAAYSALGTSSNLISLDSLDEFSVRSSTISSSIGRQSGGHVQLTSRSGGDAYHGEGFELFRNSAVDALDWFTTTDTAVNTNLRQNDFGGLFSGPTPAGIKWIGRNYFFLSAESLRLLQPTSLDTYVPSNSLRSRAQPKLLPFLNVFPTSRRPDPGTGTSRFRLGISNPSSEDNYAFRFDSRHNLPLECFVRYSHSASSRISTDTGWALSSSERRSQTLTAGVLWKLHTNIVNDLRLNFGENTGTLTNSLHRLSGATIPSEKVLLQGISSIFKMPSLNYYFLGLTYASKNTGHQPIHQINVTDSIALEHGKHTFGVGVDYLRLVGGTVPSDFNLTVNFLSQRSIISGIADSLVIQSQDAVTVKHDIVSLYAQDSWNAIRRLTLDYGIRWDLSPAPIAEDGQHLYTVTSSKDTQAMSLAPAGTELYPTVYTNIGPRAGFSWELSGRSGTETVLHGGLGWFYSLGNTYSMAPASNFPHLRQDTLYNYAYPPIRTLPAPSSNSLLPPYSGQTFFAYASDYAPPGVYQFSTGLEQHLGQDRKLSIAYIGSESRHLPIIEMLTDPNPNFIHGTSVSEVRTIGTASYSSLQAQFGQKITNRAKMLASYTWAHCIDNVSEDLNGFARKTLTPVTGEYGNSDFDLRQNFGMGLTYQIQEVRFDSPVRKIYDGWAFGAILIARGGMPLDVTFTRPVGSQLLPTRPDIAKDVSPLVKDRHQPWGTVLNYKAFLVPSGVRQGTLARNSLRGHGAWQADLSMQRDFHLKDQWSLRVRSEFFNAFNHPNFGVPDADLGTYADGSLARNTNFGRITRMLNTQLGGLQQAYQMGGPRSVQLSMKLIF